MTDRRTAAGDDGPAPRPSIATATVADVEAVVEPLWREYGEWVASHLARATGATLTEQDLARHHDAFRAEIPGLLGPGGRLLVARLDHEPVGVGALRPIDATTAEIKRMYVRPTAQGLGIGRALLGELVAAGHADGRTTLRLETLGFMTAAREMYRTAGFTPAAPFAGSETVGTVLAPLTLFMEHRATTGARPEGHPGAGIV